MILVIWQLDHVARFDGSATNFLLLFDQQLLEVININSPVASRHGLGSPRRRCLLVTIAGEGGFKTVAVLKTWSFDRTVKVCHKLHDENHARAMMLIVGALCLLAQIGE